MCCIPILGILLILVGPNSWQRAQCSSTVCSQYVCLFWDLDCEIFLLVTKTYERLHHLLARFQWNTYLVHVFWWKNPKYIVFPNEFKPIRQLEQQLEQHENPNWLLAVLYHFPSFPGFTGDSYFHHLPSIPPSRWHRRRVRLRDLSALDAQGGGGRWRSSAKNAGFSWKMPDEPWISMKKWGIEPSKCVENKWFAMMKYQKCWVFPWNYREFDHTKWEVKNRELHWVHQKWSSFGVVFKQQTPANSSVLGWDCDRRWDFHLRFYYDLIGGLG